MADEKRTEPKIDPGGAAFRILAVVVPVLFLLVSCSEPEVVPDAPVVAADQVAAAVPEATPAGEAVAPLTVGGDVLAPVKVFHPAPQYTEIARTKRVQGKVILRAVVTKEGAVSSVEVLQGLSEGLQEEAAKAIERWRFQPATLHGEPVDVYFNLTVNFQLR